MTKFSEFKNGCLQEIPLQLGVFPFGIAYGILGIEVGLTNIQTYLLSIIIFAGVSQIVFAQLFSTFTPSFIIVGTIGIVNLRHILYGVSLSSYLKKLSLKWRVILSYLITDEAFAISYKRFSEEKKTKYMHFHLLGSGITLWISWQISTLIGIFIGPSIPISLNLEYVIPLSFIAIVVVSINTKIKLIVFIMSALFSILLRDLPWNLWIITSALISIIIGVLISNFRKGIK
ncbi:MAG: AzlC family ABC transporter permease [Dehalococcoidia bacterium]|jgi:predicted branched-subunit amino acid permease|nr:AzlC family ABC transporter permease [Dehalococcoidia bacterium]|tara:strand:- start:13 stop:705 length:693 start_codon:yes stop_codon:yes gene_type:complete